MSEGPVSGRRIKRRTIHYTMIGVVVVGLIVASIIGANIYFKSTNKQTQQTQKAELADISDNIASKVTSFFSPIQEQLDKLDINPLIEVLKGDDKSAISEKADVLLGKIPGSLKVRLFKTGDYELDRKAKPPLGFASVAMLRTMEKSEDKTGIELHMANSPDRHIVVVSKLEDSENNLAGLIHISLDPAPLLEIIERHEDTNTYVELTQVIGGNTLVLANKGNTGLKKGNAVSTVIDGTSLTVNVWGSSGAPVADTGGPDLISLLMDNAIVIIIGVLALAIIGFVITRRKMSDEDETPGDIVYGGAVMAIMEGAHPGLEKLVPNLPNLGQSKTIRPLSQGLIADDVTVVEKSPQVKPASKPKPPVVNAKPVTTTAPENARALPEQKSVPGQAQENKTTPGEKSAEPEEKADATEDMSMEFEMPGADSAAKPEAAPGEQVASLEEMSMEFDPPGETATTEKPEAEPKEKADAAEDMSLEFELPGAESSSKPEPAPEPEPIPEPASEEKADAAEDMSLEFELPGAESSSKPEPAPEPEPIPEPASKEKTDTTEDLSMAIELPGEEDAAMPTDESVDITDVPEDLSMEFELPAADTTPPEDLSMEFELPDSEDVTTPREEDNVTSSDSSDKKKDLNNEVDLVPEIFRAYDIRGIVGKTLDSRVAQDIGLAIGTEAQIRGQHSIIVGRDGRTSSPELAQSMIAGITSTGCDVIDIGVVPTPTLYFATHHLDTDSGVMITGSHNGPEYNGFKIILAGEKLTSEEIQEIHARILARDFKSGEGSTQTRDISDDYIGRITDDVPVALGGAFKIVIDCGNGVTGNIAPKVFKTLGHEIIEMYCDIDGNFPNHHPDPSQPENLNALIAKIKEVQADIGIAFDGDGDRLGVVDGNGKIIWPDRQMMLFAIDVLSRNQGKSIIFDIKCSRHLKSVIEKNGGTPVMWKTGHTFIKEKLKELDAPLAGELSGHIFFKERWYGFDDAIYAGARLMEALAASERSPAEVFAELPEDVSTPEIRIDLKEKYHAKFMKMFRKKMKFENVEITDIDGIRVDFPNGWGLIRPSNTTPCLIARFEAEDEKILHMIQSQFHDLIHTIAPNLKLPF